MAAESAEPATASVSVTPRGYDAWEAFDELARQGGPKVLMLGEWWWRPLVVPVELRFKPVDGRKLVEAVAAEYELKVAWVREGKYAILFAGAADQEVARVKDDLASADAAVRREAAWRGGWLRDVRIVPLLVKAAKDADAEVARQAVVGLRRMRLGCRPGAGRSRMGTLAAELASHDANVRRGAASALGSVGGEKALALIEKALADQDADVRCGAASRAGERGRGEGAGAHRKGARRPGCRTCAVEPLTRWGAWAGRRRWRSSKRRSPTRTLTCAVAPLARWGAWAGRRRWRSRKGARRPGRRRAQWSRFRAGERGRGEGAGAPRKGARRPGRQRAP